MNNLLNFNVGILGHVDSGKTSLAKALSTVASTAAFDKNPQSKERGITIDLGFSSFCVDAPPHVQKSGYSKLQVTLVDCPGHASLIRTIIGGAQIIDGMILVIDITKGVQTQTAECLVIGEILCKQMIVVLNKIDLIPEVKKQITIEKMTKKVLNTLKNTKFSNCKIVSLSACPGGADSSNTPIGLNALVEHVVDSTYVPVRQTSIPLVFSVDHCFSIKGQGTIMTGTVLQGTIAANENIDIPILKVSKKVKSIQMFRQPVEKAAQGDRIGVCVTQFDPTHLERSLVGTCDYINMVHGFIAEVHKIGYYKLPINSKAKFHISLGHDTVMSKVTFFGSESKSDQDIFIHDKEYHYQDELIDVNKLEEHVEYKPLSQYVLVEFDRVVPLMPKSLFIASKLDMDIHTNMCRLAFWGKVIYPLVENYKISLLPSLKIYKDKDKEGTVERMNSDTELIVNNLLKKGTDINLFMGLKVSLSTGERAIIDGNFGQSGKTKIRIDDLKPETKVRLKAMSDQRKRNKKGENTNKTSAHSEPIIVRLQFKKYIYSIKRGIVQT